MHSVRIAAALTNSWFLVDDGGGQRGRMPPTKRELSYVVHGTELGSRSRKPSSSSASEMIGGSMWRYLQAAWPVYSKFFDNNLGPIPHHMHQNQEQGSQAGARGQARKLLFPAAA